MIQDDELATLESTEHDESFIADDDDELIEDENDVILDGEDDENDHMFSEAINDVYGSTSDGIKTFEDAEQMLKRARQELVEAFKSIPDVGEMRKAYDQAVLRCPHLIELESPPDKYLRAHNFNAWEASYAIVYYWRKRVEVFGPHLAFYPLTLTGNGALSEQVVEAIKTGLCCVLPDADNFNRQVMLFNRGKMSTLMMDPEIRSKTVFYHLKCLLESDNFANGCVAIFATDTPWPKGVHFKPDGKVMDLLKSEPVPIKAKAIHIMLPRMPGMFVSCLSMWRKVFSWWNVFRMRVQEHFPVDSTETLNRRMEQFGLSDRHFPRRLCGSLDEDKCAQSWIEGRLRIDSEKYKGYRVENISEVHKLAEAAGLAREAEKRNRKRRLEEHVARNKRISRFM